MKYRICYCPDCGKVSEYGCIQIDKKIEEIFGEDN